MSSKSTKSRFSKVARLLTIFFLSTVLAILSMLIEGYQAFCGVLPFVPCPEPSQMALAQSHVSQGEYEQAEEIYKRKLEEDPTNHHVTNLLAWLYADKMETNLADAIILSETAIALAKSQDASSGTIANYHDTIGWAYYKDGQYEAAKSNLELAIQLSNRQEFRGHLATVLEAMNQ